MTSSDSTRWSVFAGLSGTLLTVPAVLVVGGFALYFAWLANDWLPALAIVVLWAGWVLLTPDGQPPVIALAFTHQWLQVTIGIFFAALSGLELRAHLYSDYRPMVLIGLGCLVVLMIGLWAGMRPLPTATTDKRGIDIAPRHLAFCYLASIPLTGVLHEAAWYIPGLTQGILALNFARFGLLFLIFRHLVRPRFRWPMFVLVLAGEVVLGFSGYFAGFREALVLAGLALLEVFDRRQLRHWAALAGVAAAVAVTAVVWTGIKVDVRRAIEREGDNTSAVTRLERVADLAANWVAAGRHVIANDVYELADRMWTVHYPALAVSRVPDVLPYENGAILATAIRHVLSPRLLNPEKEAAESDSLAVRKYAGVWVAGPESGTSIAFGYAAESYVDFGLPWMFLPIFLFAFAMGRLYRWLLRTITHRDLAVAAVTVIFWLALYLFERSWLRTLGLSLTLTVYLGGLGILVDRYLIALRHSRALQHHRMPLPTIPPPRKA